jgi:4-amino-4-deoxy-L-arabinose transferase-like glycosyltransferase
MVLTLRVSSAPDIIAAMRKLSSRQIRLIKFTCIGLTVAVYFLRLDSNVGLMIDDSWYVLLAKSIAEGHGYHLINSTAPQTLPLYPPGFPAILSFIWSFNPNFPNNVIAMKLVSLAALALTWKLLWQLHRQYFQASEVMCWLTTTAVMLTPLLVYYATSTLMSECVFLLLQTLVMMLYWKAESGRNQWKLIFAIGSIVGVAALIRIAGMALVLAAGLIFLLRKKFAAAALIFFLGFLPVGIWSIYSLQSAPPAPEERSNYIANNYLFHFLRSDENNLRSPNVTATEFARRVSHNVIELSSSSFGQLFVPLLNPKRSTAGMLLSCFITLILLIGIVQAIRSRIDFTEIYFVISLVLILGWAFSPTRFLVVLMPILLQYFSSGIGWLAGKFQWQKANFQLIAISILLAGFVVIHFTMLAAKYDVGAGLKNKFAMFEQQRNLEEIIQWTKQNIPADEVIATDVPALIFLHTNHRTVHLIDPEKDRELWRQLGIRHVVLSGITTAHPLEGFQLLFSTNDQKAFIYQVQ